VQRHTVDARTGHQSVNERSAVAGAGQEPPHVERVHRVQVLDEGHLTDSAGRRVDFKNALLMLTSNLGTGEQRDGVDERERVMTAVRRHFRPEFINRLDDVIVFRPVDRAALVIVELHLAALRRLMAEQRIGLEVSSGAAGWLAEQGYQPEYGARPLRRRIQDALQDPIADLIIRGELGAGSRVEVDLDQGALVVRPAP
jgi:ATP-dependent Clp protease ATP-binding subunit ClpA